ncbi:hypothetical protein pb186bvf_012229 [Paramecium bursaria]
MNIEFMYSFQWKYYKQFKCYRYLILGNRVQLKIKQNIYNIKNQMQEEIEELTSAQEYFAFLSKKISDKEILSVLPFFDCEEPGHKENTLDQVCLDQECKFKGLCCVRCSYQKHRFHPNFVYPIHTFVSQLIQQLQNRKISIDEQKQKCTQYRDLAISILRDYLSSIIDHLSVLVAQIHRYFTIFENSYENTIIKSHILVHSLIYKKHIRKDKFQKYVREGVKCIQFQNNVQQSPIQNDYYKLSQQLPQKLDDRLKQERGQLVITEQEKAYEMSMEFQQEMQKVAKQIQIILRQSQENVLEQLQLHKLSPKIPRFEQALLPELAVIKNQLTSNVDQIFTKLAPLSKQEMQSKATYLPKISEIYQRR